MLKDAMSVSVTNEGAMEPADQGNAEAVFQVMSNELATPNILVCPADKSRWPAPSFSVLTASNLSYFVNIDCTEANPEDIFAGDDDLEIHGVRVKSGLLVISSNKPVAWSADRHGFSGNVALADGSVQGMNDFMLTNWFGSTNQPPMRLAIP